jgi:hypothetical protein
VVAATGDKAMNHDALIRHLTHYADLMIKDLLEQHARSYLRGCIPVWREHYGTDVAREMGQLIKVKLEKSSKEKK